MIRINIPPVYSDMAKFNFRYYVVYGGRGSAKSWSIARFLIGIASYLKLRILCTRELQTTIGDSVHKLLADQIDNLGLGKYYNVTQKSIISTAGSEFIFKGMRHNVNEIKSLEGVDICWVEEAQSTSEDSWKIIIPTIRKEASCFFISFNTGEVLDPTYQRFVMNPPDDCITKKVSWRDNPYFPEVLNKERLYLQRIDKEVYQHIWEGEPLSISNASVFKGRYKIDTFETPEGARFFHGADWGFSQDPTVLIRCFIKDNKLFIDREAYGVGVELDEIPALFRNSVPTVDRWSTKADNSRPETISYLLNKHRINVSAAKKWQGSVEDGISYLKKFEEIVIHPRCIHTIEEFRAYSYKTDRKTGEVLPILIDKNNHCIDALRYALDGYINDDPSFVDFIYGADKGTEIREQEVLRRSISI
jgi:phage terminase large subunit